MSGGYFDYKDHILGDISDRLEEVIKNNLIPDEYGYSRQYCDDTLDKFRCAVDMLRKVAIYVHRIDYLLEGDDGEETFHERLKEDLSSYEQK